jgi:hypothetical protein
MHKAEKTEVATLPEVKEEDGTAAPHWKRNLAVCIFGSFTTIVSLTLVVPFLPLYVEQLGVQGRASIAAPASLTIPANGLLVFARS